MSSNWSIPLDKWAEKTGEKTEDIVVAAISQLNSDTILGTPIDQGRARGGWVPSIGSPSTSGGGADRSGGRTVSRANSVAKKAPGRVYYLTNNVVYIRVLEYGEYPNPPETGDKTTGGFSKQAPHGMARIAVKNLQNAINKI